MKDGSGGGILKSCDFVNVESQYAADLSSLLSIQFPDGQGFNLGGSET